MAERDASGPHRSRILVADDEPHIRRILGTFLEASGFQVDEAINGKEALEFLEGPQPYELALLDIMMPLHTGLEVLEAVRKLPHRQQIPVIILTAKGQDADRDMAFRIGASAFMTKPFSPKKLLARINELLESS